MNTTERVTNGGPSSWQSKARARLRALQTPPSVRVRGSRLASSPGFHRGGRSRGAAATLIALLVSDTVDITAGLGENVTNEPFGAAVLAACRLLLRSI